MLYSFWALGIRDTENVDQYIEGQALSDDTNREDFLTDCQYMSPNSNIRGVISTL